MVLLPPRILLICTSWVGMIASAMGQGLPQSGGAVEFDWLINKSRATAEVNLVTGGREVVMSNGLLSRTWRIEPNLACVAFDNLMTGQSMLRSVRPEARLTLDGIPYAIGGLIGQPNHAYLTTEWLDAMKLDPKAMKYIGMEVGEPMERLAWAQVRHHAPDVSWPPAGVSLRFDFSFPDRHPEDLKGEPIPSALQAQKSRTEGRSNIRISVHYELYDGTPVMSKWLSIHNGSNQMITVDRFTCEELAVVEQANWVEKREGVALPRPDYLHVETDMAFGGFQTPNSNRHVVHWRTDPLYSTQVNWARETPCLLVVEPTYGPAQEVNPGMDFETFHVFELAYDSTDRERRGLALRRMYRTIAPWVTENPLMHHLLANDPEVVRRAIDQAVEVGFEMVILSFGSGFDIENEDPAYIKQWKDVADYAEQCGIDIGGYSLLSSRKIGGGNDVVSPEGQQPTHGNCPALTSEWGLNYYRKLYNFFEKTGMDVLEHDGPYPGDVDVTERLPLQKGEQDSRWVQWRIASKFYSWCREQGIYVNAPDYYYLNGSNKCGMGYREVNWSLPRAQQLIHTRQNIYDGTWRKTPSMGWMFVPLTQYHGGGAAATIEPLDQHLDHYRGMLLANLGLGVQACYRGPRLFDTDRTRDMLKEQVAWFKKYRDILESDVVHGRRADGRDLDWMLHVNPNLKERGMLVVYNPLKTDVQKTIRVNLYFTGLTDSAEIGARDAKPEKFELARDYSIDLDVYVPAGEMQWFVIR